jgi:hypothetical protein
MANENSIFKTQIPQSGMTFNWKGDTPAEISDSAGWCYKNDKWVLTGLFTTELPSSCTSGGLSIGYKNGYFLNNGQLDIIFKFNPLVLDALSSIELEYTPGESFEYNIVEKANIRYGEVSENQTT